MAFILLGYFKPAGRANYAICTLVGLCFMPFHSMPVTILLRGLN